MLCFKGKIGLWRTSVCPRFEVQQESMLWSVSMFGGNYPRILFSTVSQSWNLKYFVVSTSTSSCWLRIMQAMSHAHESDWWYNFFIKLKFLSQRFWYSLWQGRVSCYPWSFCWASTSTTCEGQHFFVLPWSVFKQMFSSYPNIVPINRSIQVMTHEHALRLSFCQSALVRSKPLSFLSFNDLSASPKMKRLIGI